MEKLKVDLRDLKVFNARKWNINRGRNNYVQHSRKGKTVMLHRVIMRATTSEVVDHINGNPLDNRRCNLRVCTQRQNNFNVKGREGTSRYKGVYFITNTTAKNWVAKLGKFHLGCFETQLGAAKAYNEAAREWYGEFAKLNVIEGEAS